MNGEGGTVFNSSIINHHFNYFVWISRYRLSKVYFNTHRFFFVWLAENFRVKNFC
jgi:hypothetical protein